MQVALVSQNLSVALSCACIGIILSYEDMSTAFPVTFWLLASLIVLFGAVGQIASLASTLAVEKDWVKTLCGDDSALLSATNAFLRRLDLISKILAPMVRLLCCYASVTRCCCPFPKASVLCASASLSGCVLSGVGRSGAELLSRHSKLTSSLACRRLGSFSPTLAPLLGPSSSRRGTSFPCFPSSSSSTRCSCARWFTAHPPLLVSVCTLRGTCPDVGGCLAGRSRSCKGIAERTRRPTRRLHWASSFALNSSF